MLELDEELEEDFDEELEDELEDGFVDGLYDADWLPFTTVSSGEYAWAMVEDNKIMPKSLKESTPVPPYN